MMSAVTVSPKFQVVIPKAIRNAAGIRSGQKLEMYAVDGIIQLVPILDIEAARGFLGKIDTSVEREPDRDL